MKNETFNTLRDVIEVIFKEYFALKLRFVGNQPTTRSLTKGGRPMHSHTVPCHPIKSALISVLLLAGAFSGAPVLVASDGPAKK